MRFYVLTNPMDDCADAITDFCDDDSVRTGDAPRCPVCSGAIGMLPLLPPIKVELELWRKRFGDFAFGPGNGILISQRVKDEIFRSRLTGLSRFDPVEVVKTTFRRGKIKEPSPKYFYALPVHSTTTIDPVASGIDYGEPWTCENCRVGYIKRFRRVIIEQGTWSGEDIFFARGLPGLIITTERFKEVCDRYEFKNCVLVSADQYGKNFYPQDRPAEPTVNPQGPTDFTIQDGDCIARNDR